MFFAAVLEASSVAKAKGIKLSEKLIPELTEILGSMPPSSKSSTLVDLENGKRLELSAGVGTVVRLGGQLGIDTPVCSTIYAALAPFADGNSST